MTEQMLSAIIGHVELMDYGEHAQFGAWKANQKTHLKYLRRHRLGKFAKGKRKKINQFILTN